MEVYGYGNYAKRKVEGGFYFRNPHDRGGVTRGPSITVDGDSYLTVAVADIDGIGRGGECEHIRIVDPNDFTKPAASRSNGVAHPGDVDNVVADPNCESFYTRFPGGFVPRFGGVMEDYGFAMGVRGELFKRLARGLERGVRPPPGRVFHAPHAQPATAGQA